MKTARWLDKAKQDLKNSEKQVNGPTAYRDLARAAIKVAIGLTETLRETNRILEELSDE